MKHIRTLALAAAAILAGAGSALAQEAFTTNDVNMRAGPGSRFPVITTIPEGRDVVIHGCISDWDWCDVSWRRERGWVFSDYLEAYYRQRVVPFYEYRSRVGIPVVSFGFGYWDRYYRDRPWFDDWDRWSVRFRYRDTDRDRDRERDRDRVRDSNRVDNDGFRDGDDDNRARDRVRDRDRNRVDDGDRVDDRNRPERRVRRDGDGNCDGPDPDPSCFRNENSRRIRGMNDNDDNTQ